MKGILEETTENLTNNPRTFVTYMRTDDVPYGQVEDLTDVLRGRILAIRELSQVENKIRELDKFFQEYNKITAAAKGAK